MIQNEKWDNEKSIGTTLRINGFGQKSPFKRDGFKSVKWLIVCQMWISGDLNYFKICLGC